MTVCGLVTYAEKGEEISMICKRFFQVLIRRGLAAVISVGIVLLPVPSVYARSLGEAACTSGGAGLSWYCAHRKNHVQPEADARFDFVEAHDGYYIDHRHADPEASDKVVYLTFDAGYENGNVARVLDALREESVPGAFFVLGHLAETNPALIRRMTEEGHLVCNHTFTHKNLTGASPEALANELGRLERACLDCAGVTVSKYYRPPEGRFDQAMLDAASSLGYKTIFWSFAYSDWDNARQPDPAWARKKILDNVHNGAVMLLHPTSETNATVLGEVIRTLKSEGYRFGTLDELTAANVGAGGVFHGAE